jgi:hypothetical protein
MELTEGSETSANYNLTPGKYPKEQIQYSKHGESLKSRKQHACLNHIHETHIKLKPVCGTAGAAVYLSWY